MRYRYAIPCGLAGTLLSGAALASIPFNVDDPPIVEEGQHCVTTQFTSSQVRGRETQSIPTVGWRYGVSDQMELRLGFGGATRRVSSGRDFGLADTTFQVKWRFKPETEQDPQMAIGYQGKIPTADRAHGLGSGNADHRIWVSALKGHKRVKLYGNIGYNVLGGSAGKDNCFYGAVLSYQTTEKWMVGIQTYGNSSPAPGRRDELAWGVGARYMVSPSKFYFAQVGKSEHGYSDLNISAGCSIFFR